ncbi:MAG: L-fucose isomerase [Dysgonamonadaceae bacterium]|jgi:L-fucose isomerase|nr:L-fucose isomerase [Dysgonamonadaceae bacterium]
MNRNRFQGNWPKIGIRPTIDGRMGGVRESLEKQTMDMAHSVVDYLSGRLRYPDGSPVEFVIADSTIGRVAESAAAAAKFAREGVGVTITVTPCWCYGSETMDMDSHTIKAVYGFNGTERPGAVYLAAVLAAHAQKGLPAFGIYGHDVMDATDTEIPGDVREKLLLFSRAALAAAIMKGKSYLSIGAVCMGIAGSIVNTDFFEDYLGMRCEGIDEVEIIRRMTEGIYDREEYERALEWTKRHCHQGEDTINRSDLVRSSAQSAGDWEFVVKMTLIVRDLLVGNPKLKEMGFGEESLGHNAIAGGFQGQRQWTDFYPNGDFTEAILNSSFDWNGTRAPFVLATENDSLNGAAMLFGHLLTNTASIFADVRTYWSPESLERVTGRRPEGLIEGGMIHLINSGAASLDGSGRQRDTAGNPAMKPFWEISGSEVEACLEATTWMPANREYFRGGGYSSKFLTVGGMPCTMVRLNLIKGLGPVLQLAEGWTGAIDAESFEVIDNRTDRGWPTTWFVPRLDPLKDAFKDVYSVMNNWGANHGAVTCGHIGAELATLCSMLRIPVSMHNLPDDRLYRPAVWNSFGMDKEGSDYRACAAYGPLYKK